MSGDGTDLLRALIAYTLPEGTATAFIENLHLEGGTGAIDGAGNSLDNNIYGNSAANTLVGLGGDDRIFGLDGDDSLSGGSGSDQLRGKSGNDTLPMEIGNLLFGASGADSFFFDGGNLTPDGSGAAVVRDFDGISLGAGNGEDNLIFASGLETGSFANIGDAAFSGVGNSEARHKGNQQVEVDQNGEGVVDQALLISSLSAADQLTASDFLWL